MVGKFPSYFFIVAAFIVVFNIYYIISLMTRNNELQSQVDTYLGYIKESEAKHKQLRSVMLKKLEEKSTRIKDLDNQLMIKHEILGKLTTQLETLKASIKSEGSDIQELRQLGIKYKEQITSLQKETYGSSENLKKLSGQTTQLMTELTHKRQDNDRLNKESKQHQIDLELVKQKLADFIGTNKVLQEKLENVTALNRMIHESVKMKIAERNNEERRRVAEENKRSENLVHQLPHSPATIDEDAPHDAGTQSPHQTRSHSPLKTGIHSAHDVDAQSPRDVDAQSARDVNAQSPRDVDAQSPRDVDVQSPRDVDAQSPRDVDAQSPRDVDAQSPRDVDAQPPRDVDAQSPPDVDAQSPPDVDAQSPRDPHDQSPRDPHDQSMDGNNHQPGDARREFVRKSTSKAHGARSKHRKTRRVAI